MEMKLKSNINIRWKTSVKISNVALAINRIEYMYVEVLNFFFFFTKFLYIKAFYKQRTKHFLTTAVVLKWFKLHLKIKYRNIV